MSQSMTVAVIVVLTFGLGFAVGRASAPTAGPGPAPSMAAPMPSGGTPFPGSGSAPAAPMMGGGTGAPPMAAPAMGEGEAPAAPQQSVSGTITEIIQVPNFTYLKLKTAKGEEWAAISSNTTLSQGQQANLDNCTLMQKFTSKTLNRTFDAIWFGELAK